MKWSVKLTLPLIRLIGPTLMTGAGSACVADAVPAPLAAAVGAAAAACGAGLTRFCRLMRPSGLMMTRAKKSLSAVWRTSTWTGAPGCIATDSPRTLSAFQRSSCEPTGPVAPPLGARDCAVAAAVVVAVFAAVVDAVANGVAAAGAAPDVPPVGSGRLL